MTQNGSYRDLKVWHKAMDLLDAIYDLLASLPDIEKYALASQMRRAVISIPSNIAEGYGRNTRPDYIRFLWIANGSLKELETQMLIARRREYWSKLQVNPAWSLAQETGKMLKGLIRSLSESK